MFPEKGLKLYENWNTFIDKVIHIKKVAEENIHFVSKRRDTNISEGIYKI